MTTKDPQELERSSSLRLECRQELPANNSRVSRGQASGAVGSEQQTQVRNRQAKWL